MTKVALLVYDISLTGGAEKVAINLANEFVNQYQTCIISTFTIGSLPDKIDSRVICYSLSNKYEKIPIKFRKYRNMLNKILKEQGIDILMSITAGVVTLAIQASKGTNAKVLYCEHSNLENRTYGLKHVLRQYYGANKADAIVALTERDRNNFIRMFKVSPDRVYAIPNWYTKSEYEYKYNPESKKIISVGRLEKVKGYKYIIECAEVVLQRNPEWQWHIYGDGSERNELQEMIDEKKIDRLVLKGNVDDIEKRYSQYAFLVMTSLYEGLPLSLLEAQASMLPIVSFDSPTGPSEIVVNCVNGDIVPMFDVSTLIEKVQALISSPEQRINYSQHAQDKMSYYEKSRVMELWTKLINRFEQDGDIVDE